MGSDGKQLQDYQFKPGQSGNPSGRPKGARSKLSERFLCDVLDLWEEHGKEVLLAMAATKPSEFAKMVATLVPKDMLIAATDGNTKIMAQVEGMDEHQLTELVEGLRLLGAAGSSGEGTNEAEAAELPS